MVRETLEKSDNNQNRTKVGQDRQKSYVNKRQRYLEFIVGDLKL